MPVLAGAGFARLVNHRPDGEEPGQPDSQRLSEAARSAGVDLILAPVRGLPDAAAVRATANALADLDDGAKILMFCRSGMRSTAAWAMVMRAAGADRESLVEAAAGAGYDLGGLPL